MPVYLYGILPAVAMVAAGNAAITPFLYFPARHLFQTMNGEAAVDEDVKDSDHSQLILEQSRAGVISIEHLSYTYPGMEGERGNRGTGKAGNIRIVSEKQCPEIG